jgi:hypothetical protein
MYEWNEVLHELFFKVLTPQVGLNGGGVDLEDTLLDARQGQIVNKDGLGSWV